MITVHLHCKFPIAARLWDVVDDADDDDYAVDDDDNGNDDENNDGDYAVVDGGDHLAPSFHPSRAVRQPRSRLLALL